MSKCPADTNNFQWEFSNFLKFLHYIDRVKPSENSSPPAFNGNQNIEAVEPFAGAERQGSAITPAIKVGIKLQPISRGGSFQRSGPGPGGGRLPTSA